MADPHEMLGLNKAYWDAAAAVHGNGRDQTYDLAGLLAGRDTLSAAENAALQEAAPSVEGLDVLHVQCHIGFGTISLARRGAIVTGVDLSPASLDKARDLAGRCGVCPTFVEADANSLPPRLWGSFDLAFASLGVVYFTDEPARWMSSVARCLRPGGHLVLVEFHPLPGMFAVHEPASAWCAYDDAGPHVWDGQLAAYAQAEEGPATGSVMTYRHTVGAVATGAVRAGLRLLSLTETTENDCPGEHGGTRETDGKWRTRIGGRPVPSFFSLVARKDA
ncbi:class I SAM-dependent methyltransferase [Streptomyces albus]|uniref:Class I SAM-dependent methyltransferase n=1 Tax=Streptomyces albus TaxID=1888 RepID=A0A6C1BXC4_9ACTN|nr:MULTISPECIES: class I SAM-dependent methyltransferase [Streptomyces]EPD97116.1 hypothetical protein HMPREF1486_00347 [Streptomyces sp. HPH0547]QID34869.1 class I SAM-dependent methyltransferase [Streptomyces albus]TGG74661.1 class I SAM-dependent methyltransferase [Streptomyces albus]UVN58329.1 class I SAM-dependent methyltransferase [Streptomyces albus]GHJ20928.1 hypothetical protein TPA0909_25420 [Streptomyces albus]